MPFPFSESEIISVLSMFKSLRKLKLTGSTRGSIGNTNPTPIPSAALPSLEVLDCWLDNVALFSQLPNVRDVSLMGSVPRLGLHISNVLFKPFFSRLERFSFHVPTIAAEQPETMAQALKDNFINLY
jgi:hypothetical protein